MLAQSVTNELILARGLKPISVHSSAPAIIGPEACNPRKGIKEKEAGDILQPLLLPIEQNDGLLPRCTFLTFMQSPYIGILRAKIRSYDFKR
jgi:hypothetical protein